MWVRDSQSHTSAPNSLQLSVGEEIRIRILAKDVSLALNHYEDSSISNIPAAEVMEIQDGDYPGSSLGTSQDRSKYFSGPYYESIGKKLTSASRTTPLGTNKIGCHCSLIFFILSKSLSFNFYVIINAIHHQFQVAAHRWVPKNLSLRSWD